MSDTPCERESERPVVERVREGQMSEPRIRTERMLQLLSRQAKEKILLIGESEGLLADMLIRSAAGSPVTWVDPVFRAAGESTKIPYREGIERLAAGCYSIPFSSEEFDAVAAQFTLEYVAEPRRALAEWARVLKTGGTMALVTKNRLFNGPDLRPRARPEQTFSPDELRGALTGCGLEVREVSTLIPNLRLPRLYRGDLSFSYRLEMLPFFRRRGMLLFVSAVKRAGGTGIVDQGRA